MLTLKFFITTENGEAEKEINFSNQPHEISLRQWADLEMRRDKWPEWFKSHLQEDGEEIIEGWDADQWSQAYYIFADCLSIFATDASFEDILQAPPHGIDGPGLISAFFEVLFAVFSYKPKTVSHFIHKDERFLIPETVYNVPGKKLSTQEAIEALQVEHIYQAKKDGKFRYEDRRWYTVLGIISALCRKIDPSTNEPEKMPLEPNELDQWRRQRMDFFQDIKMDVAMDVAFFLSDLRSFALRNLALRTYLNLLSQKQISRPKQ
jgi:hypothetical protein